MTKPPVTCLLCPKQAGRGRLCRQHYKMYHRAAEKRPLSNILRGCCGKMGRFALLVRRATASPIAKMAITKVESVDQTSLFTAIHENIAPGTMIHTDELVGYNGIDEVYGHESINHGAKEYARDGVSTNSIESVWAVLKRGLHGVYHHASKKHLGRYVDEFTFRLNEGDVKRHTLERLDSLVTATAGRRITYGELTA